MIWEIVVYSPPPAAAACRSFDGYIIVQTRDRPQLPDLSGDQIMIF